MTRLVLVGLIYVALCVGNLVLFPLLRYYRVPLMDLGKLTHHELLPGLGYVAAVAILLAGYLLALRAVRDVKDRRIVLVVLALAAVFSFTLFFVYPWAAADVYDYAAAGGVLGWFGLNPFQVPANHVVGEPWVSFAVWANTTQAYGALWALIAGAVTWVAGKGLLPNVLAFKGIAFAAYWLTIALVARSWRHEPLKQAYGLLFFAWNPLVLIEVLINGHNDIAMVLFLVWALLLMKEGRTTWAFVALAGSVLIKFVTILLLPFFLIYAWKRSGGKLVGVRSAALDLLAFAAPVALVTLPFIGGGDTFDLQRRFLMFTTSLPTAVMAVASHWLTETRAASLAQGAGMGILIAICAYYAMNLLQKTRPIEAVSFDVLWAYLVFACTWFQPWYLMWLVAVASLLLDAKRAARAQLFVLMGLISYFIFGYAWPALLDQDFTLLTFRALAGLAVMAPPMGLWAWQSLRRPRKPAEQRKGLSLSERPLCHAEQGSTGSAQAA